MVGIAGRSRACDNCRRRRIKCDLASPACSRCVKARLWCGGSQDVRFIQYDDKRRHEGPSTTLTRPGRPFTETKATEPNLRPLASNTQASQIRSSRLTLGSQMPIPHDDVFLMYTRSHLIREHGAIWFDLQPSNSLTLKCLLALSTTYFGVDHAEQPITRLGLSRYGKVLSELNQILHDPEACRSSDHLFAVVVMILFEYLIGDKGSGWVQHSRGLEELLRLQGPDSIKSLSDLIILESSRPSMIFAAIFSRQRTILAHGEWKVIPWATHPYRSDSMKLLIDILADCPELFVLRNNLTAQSHDTDRHFSLLNLAKSKALKVLDELKAWRESTPTSLNSWIERQTPPDTPIYVSFDGEVIRFWNSIFYYDSLYIANLTTLYYSIFILIAQLVRGLDNDNEHQDLDDGLYAAGEVICRSIDYQLDNVQVGADSLFILFPMRMAFDSVGKKHAEIGSWLRTKLDCIPSQTSGRWATARYLLDMKSSTTKTDRPVRLSGHS